MTATTASMIGKDRAPQKGRFAPPSDSSSSCLLPAVRGGPFDSSKGRTRPTMGAAPMMAVWESLEIGEAAAAGDKGR